MRPGTHRRQALLAATALAASIALPAVVLAQQSNNTVEELIVTATKRDATILDVPFSINAQTEADIQKSGARDAGGPVAQRRRPDDPEPRPRPEPGGGARRLGRPGGPRPAGRQGAGRGLSRRVGDLAVAVHAGRRPVRPEPGRDPARPAGHAVRLGLGRRHHPLHHQPAQAGRLRRHGRGQRQRAEGRRRRRLREGRGQHAAVGQGRPADRRLRHRIRRLRRRAGRGRNAQEERQRRLAPWRPGLAAVPADRGHQHHPARGLPEDPRRRLQSPGGVQPVRQPVHHHAAGDHPGRARAVPAAGRELRRQDLPGRPDRLRSASTASS